METVDAELGSVDTIAVDVLETACFVSMFCGSQPLWWLVFDTRCVSLFDLNRLCVKSISPLGSVLRLEPEEGNNTRRGGGVGKARATAAICVCLIFPAQHNHHEPTSQLAKKPRKHMREENFSRASGKKKFVSAKRCFRKKQQESAYECVCVRWQKH